MGDAEEDKKPSTAPKGDRGILNIRIRDQTGEETRRRCRDAPRTRFPTRAPP